MTRKELEDVLQDSDMVLIGLGEEFDDRHLYEKETEYQMAEAYLKEHDMNWLLPALQREFRIRMNSRVEAALGKLQELLKDKNYFVVAVSTAEEISQIDWKHSMCVQVVGSTTKVQKPGEEPREITNEERAKMQSAVRKLLLTGKLEQNVFDDKWILNNIHASEYDETGYLKKWEFYTKWLAGSMNKKLTILELGVGLKYPSVIRWPFEKIAQLNLKSRFYRIHSTLPMLPSELGEKGVAITQNAIEWIESL